MLVVVRSDDVEVVVGDDVVDVMLPVDVPFAEAVALDSVDDSVNPVCVSPLVAAKTERVRSASAFIPARNISHSLAPPVPSDAASCPIPILFPTAHAP